MFAWRLIHSEDVWYSAERALETDGCKEHSARLRYVKLGSSG